MSFVTRDFFVLRKPLLPLEALLEFHRITSPVLQEARLIDLFSDSLLSEAVLVASPGLFTAFQELKADRLGGRDRRKLIRTLYRYLIRLCTRSTPYGLFAGVATGLLSTGSLMDFNTAEPFRRIMRLDRGVFEALTRWLESRPTIRKQLLYGLNSSLEFRGDHFRYIERKQTQAGIAHVLAAIESSPAIEQALELARKGITIPTLIKALSGLVPRAKEMVKEMLEAQLLISELEQTVTGSEAFDRLYHKIGALKGARTEKQLVTRINGLLHTGQEPLENHLKLAELLATIEYPKSNPILKTDMVYNGRFTLSKKWVNVLAQEFDRVRPVLEINRDDELSRFREAFLGRFESRCVPLLEALDSVDGVGYGQARPGYCEDLPLLEDLDFGQWDLAPSRLRDAADRLKENLVEKAMLESKMIVVLSEKDLEGMVVSEIKARNGLYWLGSFLTDSAGELDKGNFLFLARSGGGVSGLELMGRFCDADPTLASYVRDVTQKQQRQDAGVIYAEIAHLPESRLGNILQRPHLTEHEIVYLSGSSLPAEKRIYASDLLVSVEGQDVVLTSKQLGKRVIPRLTTAHNFSNGLPVYRFLCDVAGQGKAYQWQWGHLASRTFLPRVQYGHWILSRARWRLEKERFPSLFDPSTDFQIEWEKIRNMLKIPRFVQVVDSDRELLVDNESGWSVEEFQGVLEKGNVNLVEFADGLTGLLGGWCHEVVFSFRQEAESGMNFEKSDFTSFDTQRREFLPCSEWIYLKIYCGPQAADALLADFIGPRLMRMVRDGEIEKWFFVRYADPESHLRIRYKSKGRNSCLFYDELKSLLATGRIEKIQFDTYRRELERYAGLDYECTESIFHADSEAVTSLLKSLTCEDDRWLAGLVGADQLLKDFGLDLATRAGLVSMSFEHLFLEFKGGTPLKVQMDVKYRQDRRLIEACLAKAGSVWDQAFRFRSDALGKILKKQRGKVGFRTAASYMHMFFNRVLLSQPRRQEMVLCYYLKKYYQSIRRRSVEHFD